MSKRTQFTVLRPVGIKPTHTPVFPLFSIKLVYEG